MSTSIQLSIATENERMEALNLRYRCLTLENRDEHFADHRRQFYIDPWDVDTAEIVIAKSRSSKAVVGTVRYISPQEMGLPETQVYDFSRYAESLGTSDEIESRIALLGRGAVAPSFRRSRVYAHFWNIVNDSVTNGAFSFISVSYPLQILLLPHFLLAF